MSAIVSELRLKIADYEQNLAKVRGEAAKLKTDLAAKTAGIEEAVLGKTARYQAIIDRVRREAKALKAELADMQSAKSWGSQRVDMAAFRAQLQREGEAGGGLLGNGMMMGLGRSFAPVAIAGVIGAGIRSSVGMVNADEVMKVRMEVLVGHKQDSQDLIRDLKSLESRTPLEFSDLADAASQLVAFGEASKDVPEVLRRIGDISQGVGAPIAEIAEIYGKARVQGTLFAEDINQLTGRGIPVIQEFAKTLGVAEGKIKKLASEGQIGFSLLEIAFYELTKEGGRFAEMLERIGKTNLGKESRLGAELKKILMEPGEPLADGYGTFLDIAIVKARNLSAILKAVKGDFSGLADPQTVSAETKQVIADEMAAKAAAERAKIEELAADKRNNEWMKQIQKEQADRSKQQAHLSDMRLRAREIADTMLPKEERIRALKERLSEVFIDEQLKAPGTPASIKGLQGRADALRGAGNARGEEATLKNLQIALQLQREIASITAKDDQSDMKAAAKEMLEISRAQKAFGEAEIVDLRARSSLSEQILQIQREMADIQGLADSGVVNEQTRLDLQRQILALKSDERSVTKQMTEETLRIAAVNEARGEKIREQDKLLADFEAELAIIRAQAQGRRVLADHLQREYDLEKAKLQIMEQTGVSEAKALQMARERADLEAKINQYKSGGDRYDEEGRREDGRKRIEGYHRGAQDGQGKVDRMGSLDDFYNDQRTPLRDSFKFPGLDEYDQRQQTPLRDSFKFPGLDAYDELQRKKNAQQGGGLEDQARKNEQAKNGQPGGQETQAVAQLILQSLPQILTALTTG